MSTIKWIAGAIPVFFSALFITFLFLYFIASFNPQFRPQAAYVIWLLPPLVIAWYGFFLFKRFIPNDTNRYLIVLFIPWIWILSFAVLAEYVLPIIF